MEKELLLKATNINKGFPGVQALDNVNFDLYKGEVHVLIGENGAGKSTLMKIIAGAYQPDSGSLEMNGKHVRFNNPQDAQEAGVAIIYQEFNLIPNMNVAQNMFLGRFPKKLGMIIDHKTLHAEATKVLKSLSLDIDTHAFCADLGTGQQQMVEVAKALTMDSKVLIMDEPTAALTEREIVSLFEMTETLKAKGIGIIYISHRLEEVKIVGDRVTVQRDGKYIGTKDAKEVEIAELVKMMVGRDVKSMYAFAKDTDNFGEEMLRVENLVSGTTHQRRLSGCARWRNCGAGWIGWCRSHGSCAGDLWRRPV